MARPGRCRAPAHGDDTAVSEARALAGREHPVIVVTADRGLRERVTALGVECRGPRWFLTLMV